jgi:hypothetical protein
VEIGVQFEVVYKDDDLIEVRISASNGTFCGEASAYLGIGEVEEIATKLQGFPTRPSDAREIMLGTFDPNSAGGGMSMRFYCSDRSGHAYVEARIESGHESTRVVQSVVLLLPLEAAAVDSFVDELRRLDAGIGERASLKGAVALRT